MQSTILNEELLKKIVELIKKTPNDMVLGQKIRKLYNDINLSDK